MLNIYDTVVLHVLLRCVPAINGGNFGFILSSLDQGLKSLDVSISSACASAVDNLASFYFRNVVREPEIGRPAQGSAVGYCVTSYVIRLF
jgi:exportin-7